MGRDQDKADGGKRWTKGFIKWGDGMIKPALYRIDQVTEILNCSRRTVYRLLADGKLIAHNDNPGKQGTKIIASSVEKYIESFKLPKEYFNEKSGDGDHFKRKMISKGIE